MNQSENPEFDLILDYLTGELSEESCSRLEKWIAESDENKNYFNDLQKTWNALKVIDPSPAFDSEKAYASFKKRMISGSQPFVSGKLFKRWLYIAAVWIPFIFLSYFSYLYFTLPDRYVTVFIPEIQVPNGSKTQLMLQDGTKIWVNSGSSVAFQMDLDKNRRELKLTGEAYLEVAPMLDCPFFVITENVKVKVLGTRFNVNSYKENDEIKVSLLEGVVEMITESEKPFVLSPRDVVSYHTSSGQMKITPDATDNAINWVENKLVFEGETFEQIVHTLERNFNVKIHVRVESVKENRFTGDFVNNETIEQIFNVMASNGKFKYSILGNQIDVY